MTRDAAAIAAFVDGELDEITMRTIAHEAENDAVLAADIARHRALTARLSAHYAPVMAEELPPRLTNLLGGDAVIDTSLAERRESRRVRFSTAHWGSLAASAILGLTIGMAPWTAAGPVAVDGERLVAAGALASALDTQLASSQIGTPDVRIGLTFKDKDDRFCRSFEGPVVSGIGCRVNDRWQLEQTMKGATPGDYRQASSGSLAAVAAEMMAGVPLDAAEERRARDKEWR